MGAGLGKHKGKNKKKIPDDALLNTVFYFAMSENELAGFHNAFQVEFYKPGKTLVAEGEECFDFFVVARGEVNVMHEGSLLCVKERGSYFGVDSNSLTSGDPIVSDCEFVTNTKTTLLRITPEALKVFIDTVEPPPSPQRISEVLKANLTSERILEKVPWLNGIDVKTRSLLRHMLSCEVHQPHTVIFREGSVGSDMYIVCHGALKAISHVQSTPGLSSRLRRLTDPEMKELTLNEFHTGDYFGEIGLACKMPRTADVISCEEKCLLLRLERRDFDNFFSLVPQFKDPFDSMVVQRTAESFRKYKIPFFDSIPIDKYQVLAPLCEIMPIGPKTTIFEEDDVGHSFYIIAYGTVTVSTRHSGTITTFGPGKYFGELALTSPDTKRRATVKTITKCILLTFQKKDFDTFLKQVPEAEKDFHVKIVNDVSFAMLLHHDLGLKCFTEFLETEYSDENIKFWTEVQDFKHLECDEKDLREKAQHIVNTYMNDESEGGQVNVSYTTKEALIDTLASKEQITNEVFAPVEKAVFSLMSNDSFQRFKMSDLMQKFLDEAENAAKI